MIEVPSTLSQRVLRVDGSQGGPVEFATLVGVGAHQVTSSTTVDGHSAREIASFLVSLVGVNDPYEAIDRIAQLAGLEVKVNQKPPVWQPGDVVRVRYVERWTIALVTELDRVQIEDGDAESIAWLSDKYRAGAAQLVLRSGEPLFAPSGCEDC